MSRVAPDLPELQRVPEAARSLVYLSALNRALRSPLTWLTGAVVVAVAVGLGANQGNALFGDAGAIIGIVAGASAAIVCFFKLILPWYARRMLPSVIDHAGGVTLDQVRQADDNVQRMIEAYKRQERGTPEAADRRGPERLP
jgi:hypothetical protein